MRVLWFSNKLQSTQVSSGAGSWLDAMAGKLLASGEVELGNIAFGAVDSVVRQDAGLVQQWAAPMRRRADGRPRAADELAILDAARQFAPDVVHVWGTEAYWGLLTSSGLINEKTILEMQGLKAAIARVFHGGLTVSEQIACVGVKEVARRMTPWQQKARFETWAQSERAIIGSHRHITVQTNWMEAQVRNMTGEAQIHRMDLMLRNEFYSAPAWMFNGRPLLFCSAAYSAPFKGLHVAIRALVHLKKRFPDVQLRIAGPKPRRGVRRDGYLTWLRREARSLGVEANVAWLGPLAAGQIVEELLRCSVMLVPTFIENCCTALCEAMAVGIPAVVSYAGGNPDIAVPEESALFMSPGDDVTCASQIERLLSSKELATRVSQRARQLSQQRSNPVQLIRRQLEIYHSVIARDLG